MVQVEYLTVAIRDKPYVKIAVTLSRLHIFYLIPTKNGLKRDQFNTLLSIDRKKDALHHSVAPFATS